MTEIQLLTEAEARSLTAELRTAATTFFTLLEQAFQRGAHTALGYRTFRAYLNGEFPGFVPPKLDRASRNAVIKGLLDAGMSTRDAGQATASSAGTVNEASARFRAPKTQSEPPVTPESEAEERGAVPAEETRVTPMAQRLAERLQTEAAEHCLSLEQDTADAVWRVVDNLAKLAYDSAVPRAEAFQALDAFTLILRHIK
jgi:hypothetical protein